MKAEFICHNERCDSYITEFGFHHVMLVDHPGPCPVCRHHATQVTRWVPSAHRFALGNVVMTPGAVDILAGEAQSCRERAAAQQVMPLLERHAAGDWGEVGDEDTATNNASIPDAEDPSLVLERRRVLSSYEVRGEKLWIITEAGRHETTVLLPSEY